MEETNEIREFLFDINSRLGNVIEVIWKRERNHPHFELSLRPTEYVMRDQVVLNIDNKFSNLIISVALRYFKTSPGFNNTGRIFWFIE